MGLVAHPVFKTGRAEQPSAWKVRFLRRSVWRTPRLQAGFNAETSGYPRAEQGAADTAHRRWESPTTVAQLSHEHQPPAGNRGMLSI
jgi:hypothetical protein